MLPKDLKRQLTLWEFAELCAYRRLKLWPKERAEAQRAGVAAQICELLRDPKSGRKFRGEDFMPKTKRSGFLKPEEILQAFLAMPGAIVKGNLDGTR